MEKVVTVIPGHIRVKVHHLAYKKGRRSGEFIPAKNIDVGDAFWIPKPVPTSYNRLTNFIAIDKKELKGERYEFHLVKAPILKLDESNHKQICGTLHPLVTNCVAYDKPAFIEKVYQISNCHAFCGICGSNIGGQNAIMLELRSGSDPFFDRPWMRMAATSIKVRIHRTYSECEPGATLLESILKGSL